MNWFFELVSITEGVDNNTDISALYNTNILTAITQGTFKIEIDDMTAITPSTLKFLILTNTGLCVA